MSRRHGGWVPEQHGAWAMLVVPTVAGLVLRARTGLPGWAVPLCLLWFLGYFCFNAAGLWLKAAPRRRGSYRPALLSYAAASAVLGVVTLLLDGWPLLWWLPCFVPLLGTALWLTSRRHDRALLSGLCTVVAACLMAWILCFTTPQAVWRAGWTATSWAAPALFGYFFGTVFVVKTLIRERNKPAWVLASVGWHLAWVLVTLLAWRSGTLGVGWPVFFAVATLRAWALPWFGPRRGRVIRPAQVGMLEMVFSVVALVLCLQ